MGECCEILLTDTVNLVDSELVETDQEFELMIRILGEEGSENGEADKRSPTHSHDLSS